MFRSGRSRSLAGVSIVCIFLLGKAAFAACPAVPSQLINPGELTVGSALTSPPMGFMKDGQPTGFDTDLASALAEKMCLKPNFVNLAFQGLFPGLIARKFDMIEARVGITDERKKVFDFVPYSRGGIQLVVRKGSTLWFNTEAEVCGHSVATNAGSSELADLERTREQCPKDKPMTFRIFSNQIEALNEVAKTSVDAAYVDWPVAAYLIQQRPDDFATASPVFSGDGPGTPRHINGLVFRKDNGGIKDAVAVALTAVIADGTYDKLLQKWKLADGDIRQQSN